MEKEFKTIEEQIEILKNRNLIIKNKDKEISHFENNNYYYLINGYKDLFIDRKQVLEFFRDKLNIFISLFLNIFINYSKGVHIVYSFIG